MTKMGRGSLGPARLSQVKVKPIWPSTMLSWELVCNPRVGVRKAEICGSWDSYGLKSCMILETWQLAIQRHFLTLCNQSGWKAWVAALEILSTMEASAISGDEVSLLV